jgi:perosamine synthetase
MITIPYGRHDIDESDIEAVVDVLRNGWLTQGPKVKQFEDAVAEYVGSKYAVAVSNGTVALHLAYSALDVAQGDTVVTTPNTFVATANAAKYCGADVHFVDINSNTLNLSIDDLEASLAKLGAVKVITPVHFAGEPCDMESIARLASQHNSHIIEDAAHALGASYDDGSKVGCCKYSDMTIFSFHPVKMIAAGEGGMIVTNDEAIYRKLLRLRSHGINKGRDQYLLPEMAMTDGEENPWYYEMQELGYNYRITDIQCALAHSQLSRLDDFLDRRKKLVSQYDAVFFDLDFIKPTQRQDDRTKSAHHLYVVRIDYEACNTTRKDVMNQLKEKGIGTQVHYIPVNRQPYYCQEQPVTGTPEADKYYQEALSLPLYYSLSDEQQQYVIESLLKILKP